MSLFNKWKRKLGVKVQKKKKIIDKKNKEKKNKIIRTIW